MDIRSLSTAALLGAVMLTGVAVSPALADPGTEGDDTVIITGVEYGPKDGLEEAVESFAIEPGAGPIDVAYPSDIVSPRAVWGTSYATSTETVQLYYTGKAKAAGNVYEGKRIIRVCFWYSRDGKNLTGDICSAARDVGSSRWVPGSEVSKGVWDSLNPVAPKTIFNIKTTRITP